MGTLPMYAWVIVLIGLIGTAATVCAVLWRGALNAGIRRRNATQVATGAGIIWGTWALVTAALADADVYRFQEARAVPWIGIAVIAPLGVALALSRTPFASRVLSQPDSLWRLTVPQIFRPVGAAFLVAMVLGQLPAVFALPAAIRLSRMRFACPWFPHPVSSSPAPCWRYSTGYFLLVSLS